MFNWLYGEEDGQGEGATSSGPGGATKAQSRPSVSDEEILGLMPLANLYDLDTDKEESIQRLLHEYSILVEFQRLQELLPSGMYVAPSHLSLLTWHGVMFIRWGLYKGGVFRFKIELPDDYPESPPSLNFTTDVFHPMVEEGTGRVDLEIWFPEWKAGTDYASCALPRLHRTFATREFLAGGSGTTPLNAEARDMFMKEPAKFTERVEECVRKSNEDALEGNQDDALLQFAPKADMHDVLYQALKETDGCNSNFEDRKNMYVEWFCDDFVRNQILKKGKKKRKDKQKRQTQMDFEELRKAEARKDKQPGQQDLFDEEEDEEDGEMGV